MILCQDAPGVLRDKSGARGYGREGRNTNHEDRDSAIVAAYAIAGYSMKEIGHHFGLRYSYISRIINRSKKQEKRPVPHDIHASIKKFILGLIRMLKTQPHHKKYFRADIEGMRAIAILLVVASHFSVPGFFAGFIGVDIFFVISGYLITSILVREYENTNTIALTRFYANRLRRLLPALATMVIISSGVAYLLLPDSKNLLHSQASAMSILWLSNIYFSFADVDYFSALNTENIFLHTWSLGVEEQFYLLWPFFILSAFSLFKAKDNNQRLLICFVVIAIASIAGCIYFIRNSPISTYYMMPTRAWQFAAGALAWLLGRYKISYGLRSNIASWFGMFLLGLGLVLIEPTNVYPSMLALLPTFGAFCLLWAGSSPERTQLPNVILSAALMQKIGRLSYAWYLWHWPVLVIGENFLPIKGELGNSVLAIAVSLLLASITHSFIEKPIRFGRTSAIVPRWQIISSIVVMVLVSSQSLRWFTVTKERLDSGMNELYSRAISDIPIIYQHGCDDWYHSAEVKPCIYGREDAENTAVLMGDSIGAQWFSALTHMHEPLEWRIIVLTKSSCPMVDEPFFYTRIRREYTECSDWRNKAIEWLQQQQVDRLFLGSTASSEYTDKQWSQGTAKVLEQFLPSADHIYLIEANPTLRFNGPDCLLRNKTENGKYKNCHSTPANEHYLQVAKLLENVTQQYPTVHWLETSSFVCPENRCSALIKSDNGQPVVVYRDTQHLTDSFVSMAADHFNQQVINYESNYKQ